MPRFVPLLTGLVLASAVTYKFRDELLKDQGKIKSRVQDAKTTLENAVTEEQFNKTTSYLSDSQKYVSHRLVPSVKDSWNTQIMNAAQSLVDVDIGSKIESLWNQHVVPSVKEFIDNNKK